MLIVRLVGTFIILSIIYENYKKNKKESSMRFLLTIIRKHIVIIICFSLLETNTLSHIDSSQLKSLFEVSLCFGSTQSNKLFLFHDNKNPYKKNPSKYLNKMDASSVSTDCKLVL